LTKETSLVTRKIVTILLLSSGLALAGCASKPKELPPQPTGTTGTTTTNPPPAAADGADACSQADFLASVLADTILFDTDRYTIDSEDQGVLQSQAQWLARYPDRRITIEGIAMSAARATTTLRWASAAPTPRRTIW